MPALVPELTVTDFDASLRFYRDVLGWQVVYDRPEEGFAYLRLGGAELMIDALTVGRNFDQSLSAADRPFGRGMNLEITLDSIAPQLAAVRGKGWPFILPPEDKWYRTGTHETGQRQFVIADPDGYYLRFCAPLGTRPLRSDDAL